MWTFQLFPAIRFVCLHRGLFPPPGLWYFLFIKLHMCLIQTTLHILANHLIRHWATIAKPDTCLILWHYLGNMLTWNDRKGDNQSFCCWCIKNSSVLRSENEWRLCFSDHFMFHNLKCAAMSQCIWFQKRFMSDARVGLTFVPQAVVECNKGCTHKKCWSSNLIICQVYSQYIQVNICIISFKWTWLCGTSVLSLGGLSLVYVSGLHF